MANAHRMSMTAVVIVCSLSTQWTGTLFAKEAADASTAISANQFPTATATEGTQAATSGVGPATSVDEQSPAATTATSVAGLPSRRAHFRFDATQVTATLSAGPVVPGAARELKLAPIGFNTRGRQVYQGPPYPYPHRHHDTSIAALAIGSAAAIAGTAVLVYANRPECTLRPYAGGCGYGTKVFGSAVLAGGIAGLFIGALTW